MAINLGSAYAKVGLDASGIKSGVSQGIASLKTLETAGLAIGGAMQKIGGAMTLGLTVPIIGFFKKSIDSAMEAENALAELNAVIASTGGAAGLTADELIKMANELRKVSNFTDEQILSGESMLLTFTKIGGDVFPMATEAMLNMAEKFGSIDQAAVQLGKALNDPIGGVTALRRVGVMLTQEQEDQIKGFMAVNDIASAQKVILKELEVEFGGLAKAASETTKGSLQDLLDAFDDMAEVVGEALIPLLIPLVEGITKLFEKFQELTPFQQKMIIGFLGIVAMAGPLLVFFGTIVSAIGTIAGFITTLGGLGITAAGLGTAFATISTFITVTLIPAIAGVITAMAPILFVIAAIAIAIGILYLMWKYNIFGMRDVFNNALEALKRIWQAFMAFWRGDTEEGLAIINELFANFRENIARIFDFSRFTQAWTNFTSWLRNALTQVRNYLSTAFTNVKWGDVGKFILMGIANGMLLGLPTLITTAAKVAKAVLDQIKKSLGISSPSAEAMKLGAFTAQGFALGMQTMKPEDMAKSLTKPITQNSNSNQQVINQHFASGLTLTQVRGMIEQNNEQLVNTMVTALSG